MDWVALHAGETRLRVALPTYPFERERHWIEAPVMVAASNNGHAQPASVPLETVAAAMPAPALTAASRLGSIRDKIRTILKKLSGQDLSKADADAAFLELGFDSLFLTQVAGAFRKELGVKVTFRHLL